MKLAVFLLGLCSSLITVLIFLPFSTRIHYTLPNAIDPLLYAWNLHHNVQSAFHGFTDLLDTNIFYPEGNTLALSDTLFAQSFITAPLLLLVKNPVFVENIYVLSTFPLSVLTMFLLCVYLTKNTVASAVAGIFFAFSYPRLAQIGHLPAISSQWLPLFFLYLLRFIREGGAKLFCTMFFWYVLSLTSTIYFGVFLLPLTVIVIAFESIGLSRKIMSDRIKTVLIFFVPAFVIVSIVLFPYIRLRAEYPGIKRSLDDTAKLSAQPRDYLAVLPTSWLGDIGFPTDTNEHTLYPTFTLLLTAFSSLFFVPKVKRRLLWLFSFIAVLAFVFSLGPFLDTTKLPYYYLYKLVPLFQSVRVPARWSIFVILGLSVCASMTLSQFIHRKKITAAFLVLLVFFTEIWQINTTSVPIPVSEQVPAVYHFLKELPSQAIIAELPLIPEWNGRRMEDQLELRYDELKERDIFALEAYRTYFSAFHQKRMLNGYSGYFPNVYHDNSIALEKFPDQNAFDLLEKRRVKYILIHSKQYAPEAFEEIQKQLIKFPQLEQIKQFGTDYVYEIR